MIAATTAMAARPGDGRPIEAGRESTADPLPPDAREFAAEVAPVPRRRGARRRGQAGEHGAVEQRRRAEERAVGL